MRVRHDNKSPCVRGTEEQVSILFLGVVGIECGKRKRIGKGGGRFLERNTVLYKISPGLLWIPLESHVSPSHRGNDGPILVFAPAKTQIAEPDS